MARIPSSLYTFKRGIRTKARDSVARRPGSGPRVPSSLCALSWLGYFEETAYSVARQPQRPVHAGPPLLRAGPAVPVASGHMPDDTRTDPPAEVATEIATEMLHDEAPASDPEDEIAAVMHDHSMAARLASLEEQKSQARQPGTERSIQNHRAKGKMLARERLEYLLDDGSFQEVDLLVRHRSNGMGLEGRGRTRTGSSRVSGRSTAGWSASTARTSRSSGAPSARRTPRRSTSSWIWHSTSESLSSAE